jgi:hypothetical protein
MSTKTVLKEKSFLSYSLQRVITVLLYLFLLILYSILWDISGTTCVQYIHTYAHSRYINVYTVYMYSEGLDTDLSVTNVFTLCFEKGDNGLLKKQLSFREWECEELTHAFR